MGAFFVYILKSSVCLAFFYLFYRFLLSKETFHRFNRLALLSLIAFSICIPFINITVKETSVIRYSLANLEQHLSAVQYTAEAPVQSIGVYIILLVYLLGILIFSVRLIYSVCSLFRIISQGEKIGIRNNITLIITNRPVIPFSWLNYIVISTKDWEENGREILLHERAHIRFRHSWDLIICEISMLLHWFNPAAWLLRQELQNIHEYEADNAVINQGIDAKKYQLLLIEKAVGTQRFTSMANSFNHSKLKKRITMMLKSKSNAWARMKYIYVFPLATLAIVAFARPEISQELEKISTVKISELTPIQEHFSEKLATIAVDTLKKDVISEEEKVKRIAEATEKIKELQIDKQVEVAINAAQLQEIINRELKNINIEVQVEKALEKAQISETIAKSIQEAKIEEQIEKALQEAKIEERVEKALQEAKIEEQIERALEQVNVEEE